MELIRTDINIDFLGKAKYAITFSVLTTIASFYIWFAKGEAKYGTDYVGGHEIVVEVKEGDSEKIRTALAKGGFEEAIVQSFEADSGQYSVRIGGSEDSKIVREKVENALKAAFADKYSIKKTDFVGPTVGKELRSKAILAVVVSLFGILAYITIRFEFAFALGAVVALFHDVILSMGIYLLIGHTITMGTLAAALTIVGYSVNDTVVIFDQVRDEIFKRDKFDLGELMNQAVNQMLSRTIITSGLTLFSVLALLIFGGGAIRDLSAFLVVGIITGTYSTVFIASPVALMWQNYRTRELKPRMA